MRMVSLGFIGGEYPGSAYLDLKRAILNLHSRGVILCLVVKIIRRMSLMFSATEKR